MLKISTFLVEHMEENCVTDLKQPRFSFKLESTNKNISIVKANISINGSVLDAKDQLEIPYTGKELKPFTEYKAVLQVEDNYGETAIKELSFRTGKMGEPFKGKFITDGTYLLKKKKISPKPMTFMKKFDLEKKVKEAFVYITAIGLYELELNNKKVGEDYFTPGFTSYKHHLQYQVYDVTENLKKDNQLIVVVTGGWAVGSFTYHRNNRITANRQSFLMDLHIIYEDGSEETICTDESWLVSEEGKVVESEFYNGEVFDSSIDYNSIKWRNAAIEHVKITPKLMATYGSLTKRHELLKPINKFVSPSGKLIFDFGQNFAGIVYAYVDAKKGQKITFRHAEVLKNDELYTESLRTARAEYVYIASEGKQECSPKLTYMGFRYVSVEGISEDKLELFAYALYSDLHTLGEFKCSNEDLNKLQSNIVWSAKSNFVDIPTDCPQRDERMGWTGDIALFSPTACFNFDMTRLLEKWLLDLKVEQKRTGGIPVVIPRQGETFPVMAVAFWGDACILVPYALYKNYGNVEILRTLYPTMKKYLKAIDFWSKWTIFKRYTWRWWHQYGDWCAPGIGMWSWMNRGRWTATACWANSLSLVSEIATLLGETKDAERYAKLRKKVKKAYRKVFTNKKGKLKKEFQTAYVLPIHFSMVEGEEKENMVKNLVRLVKENDYNIGTGFPGTPYILYALADNGHIDDAYKMLLKDTCPSWLYEVKVGGTTIWERWDALKSDGTINDGKDGTGGMVSFNHYANGAVGNFLYERVAGIESLTPGYKKFKIQPRIGGNLDYVNCHLNSPYGEIKSNWTIKDNKFDIKVTIPVGTICELIMPNGDTHSLNSGEYEFSQEL